MAKKVFLKNATGRQFSDTARSLYIADGERTEIVDTKDKDGEVTVPALLVAESIIRDAGFDPEKGSLSIEVVDDVLPVKTIISVDPTKPLVSVKP